MSTKNFSLWVNMKKNRDLFLSIWYVPCIWYRTAVTALNHLCTEFSVLVLFIWLFSHSYNGAFIEWPNSSKGFLAKHFQRTVDKERTLNLPCSLHHLMSVDPDVLQFLFPTKFDRCHRKHNCQCLAMYLLLWLKLWLWIFPIYLEEPVNHTNTVF